MAQPQKVTLPGGPLGPLLRLFFATYTHTNTRIHTYTHIYTQSAVLDRFWHRFGALRTSKSMLPCTRELDLRKCSDLAPGASPDSKKSPKSTPRAPKRTPRAPPGAPRSSPRDPKNPPWSTPRDQNGLAEPSGPHFGGPGYHFELF